MTAITFDRTYALASDPGKTFAALTDAEQLRVWFAQHAHVEPREGGAYRFWGKHTPWCPDESDATGIIRAYQPAGLLGFDWRWRGVQTRVNIRLTHSADGTSLTLRHELPGPVPGWDAHETNFLLEDLWDLAMGNLDSYLRTGAPALLPDFSNAERRGGGDTASEASNDVVLSIEIDAPRAAVWRAMTDPAEMNQWISSAAKVDLRVGGVYEYGWTGPDGEPICPRKIIAFEPERSLQTDWHYKDSSTKSALWTLESITPQRTRVTVRQINVVESNDRHGYTGGWAKFLVKGKAHIEHAPSPWPRVQTAP